MNSAEWAYNKLMLDAERAQESQQSNLRSDEDNDTNIDNNSSFHFRSNDSNSEQGRRHYFFNTLRTSVVDLKAKYDS